MKVTGNTLEDMHCGIQNETDTSFQDYGLAQRREAYHNSNSINVQSGILPLLKYGQDLIEKTRNAEEKIKHRRRAITCDGDVSKALLIEFKNEVQEAVKLTEVAKRAAIQWQGALRGYEKRRSCLDNYRLSFLRIFSFLGSKEAKLEEVLANLDARKSSSLVSLNSVKFSVDELQAAVSEAEKTRIELGDSLKQLDESLRSKVAQAENLFATYEARVASQKSCFAKSDHFLSDFTTDITNSWDHFSSLRNKLESIDNRKEKEISALRLSSGDNKEVSESIQRYKKKILGKSKNLELQNLLDAQESWEKNQAKEIRNKLNTLDYLDKTSIALAEQKTEIYVKREIMVRERDSTRAEMLVLTTRSETIINDKLHLAKENTEKESAITRVSLELDTQEKIRLLTLEALAQSMNNLETVKTRISKMAASSCPEKLPLDYDPFGEVKSTEEDAVFQAMQSKCTGLKMMAEDLSTTYSIRQANVENILSECKTAATEKDHKVVMLSQMKAALAGYRETNDSQAQLMRESENRLQELKENFWHKQAYLNGLTSRLHQMEDSKRNYVAESEAKIQALKDAFDENMRNLDDPKFSGLETEMTLYKQSMEAPLQSLGSLHEERLQIYRAEHDESEARDCKKHRASMEKIFKKIDVLLARLKQEERKQAAYHEVRTGLVCRNDEVWPKLGVAKRYTGSHRICCASPLMKNEKKKLEDNYSIEKLCVIKAKIDRSDSHHYKVLQGGEAPRYPMQAFLAVAMARQSSLENWIYSLKIAKNPLMRSISFNEKGKIGDILQRIGAKNHEYQNIPIGSPTESLDLFS